MPRQSTAAVLVIAFAGFLGGCAFGPGPFSTPSEVQRASNTDLMELNTTMRQGLRVPLPKGESYRDYSTRIRVELVSRFGVRDDDWWNMHARLGHVVKGMPPGLVQCAWGWPDNHAYTVDGSSGSTQFWEYRGKATRANLLNSSIDADDAWEIGPWFDKGDYHTTIIFSGGVVSLIQCSGHD